MNKKVAFTKTIVAGISPIEYKEPCHQGIKKIEKLDISIRKYFFDLYALVIRIKKTSCNKTIYKKLVILEIIKSLEYSQPITFPIAEIIPEVMFGL